MDARILIVDDDPGILALLKLLVEREGFSVDVARDGAEALEKIENGSHVLVLLDLQMPHVNGFDVVERLRQKPQRPVVLVITALPATHVMKLDPDIVHAVIRKPFDLELLGAVISLAAGMMLRSTSEHAIAPDPRSSEVAN